MLSGWKQHCTGELLNEETLHNILQFQSCSDAVFTLAATVPIQRSTSAQHT